MSVTFKTHLTTRAAIVLATLALAGAAHAAGSVQVSWTNSDSYADIGRNVVDRERTMEILGAHLKSLGRRLPDGQTLQLEVLDVDLAGALEWAAGRDLRVVRGFVDWPRMTLRYTLLAEGRTLASGTAQLDDMAYLSRQRSSELGYEKRMLDDWFRATFPAPH